jgi:hypothetical protein
MVGPGTVNLSLEAVRIERQAQRRCIYPPCTRSLTGRQKLYCSDSHSVLTCHLRKRAEREAARTLRRQLPRRHPLWTLDQLTPDLRRALFLEAARAVMC